MKSTALFCAVLLAAPLVSGAEKEKPRADEFVYEGKTAAEWARELKAGNAKAAHALSRLGKDAIAPLMQLVRDPDEEIRMTAAMVLDTMQLDKATVPGFLALLKDEHFEVRRTAIRLLGKSAQRDAEISAALKEMLNDRDKAVAETAEEVLKQGELEPLIDEARGSLKQGDYNRALVLAERALALNPNDKRAIELKVRAGDYVEKFRAESIARREYEAAMAGKKKTVDTLLRQARDMVEKGEIERPMRILAEAQKLFPDDPAVAELRKQLELKREKMPRKVGEVDPFGEDDIPKQKKKGDVNPLERPAPKRSRAAEDAGQF